MTITNERRALLTSVYAALFLGTAAVVWGLVAGARIILFDGGYVLLGVVLSWLSLRTVAVVAAGPSARYPYGREALTPLVVLIQGVALFAVLVYAAADAVLLLTDGGSDVSAGAVALYGGLTAAAGWVLTVRLRRLDPHSELVAAERAQWMSGVGLSAVMAIGGAVALLLEPVVGAEPIRYVDPVLVLVACLLLVAVPVRLAVGAVRELLEAAPSEKIHAQVLDAVGQVRAEFGLDEPVLRETKLGRRLYLDVEVLVEPGRWDVSDVDRMRDRLRELLEHLGLDLWVGFHATTDPARMP